MTLDHAVALSLVENLPRVNLTDRLKNDANLLSQATPLLEKARAIRARAERAGIQVVAWNDASIPGRAYHADRSSSCVVVRGTFVCH